MSAHITPDGLTADVVVKRLLWLAWVACGGTSGYGFMKNNPGASEDDVFANVLSSGDYPGAQSHSLERGVHADYVFGRMMKLVVRVEGNTVILPDSKCTSDYQSWCHKYKTYDDLINAAIEELRPSAPPLSPSGS